MRDEATRGDRRPGRLSPPSVPVEHQHGAEELRQTLAEERRLRFEREARLDVVGRWLFALKRRRPLARQLSGLEDVLRAVNYQED